MIDIVGLYNALLNASIGGVDFYMLPADIETGRRVQRWLYPGEDIYALQDLGVMDGEIQVQGFLIGEDYIAQSMQLRNVFRTAGPLTLVHPWLGTMQVIQAPDKLPKLSFSDKELRVCRFSATFVPYQPLPPYAPDTLSALELSIGNVLSDAESWMAGVLAPLSGALSAFSYAQSFLSGLEGQFGALITSGPSGAAIFAAATGAVTALGNLVGIPSAAWGASTAAAIAAVPAAIADAATPTVPSAVAPGGTVTAAVAADPGDACAMLLASQAFITPGLGRAAPGPSLASALLAMVVANAAQAASNIAYSSQAQATAQAALINAAFDAAISAAAVAAAAAPLTAAPVWRDLLDLKATFAADINAIIGRLPAVVSITVPYTMPAWLIAQYISGDSPSKVFATWQDIIARNNIRTPAAVPPGIIEALAS